MNTIFTPTDTVNYTTASDTLLINVTQAMPVVTWDNPTDMVYGTPLSNAQLNANSSIDGNFVYSPPAGTILTAAQQQILSTTFTPNDTANYNQTLS